MLDPKYQPLAGGDLPWFSDYSFQLSRGFRALKAWMSIKEHGAKKYGRMIRKNIDDAQYLAELVRAGREVQVVDAKSGEDLTRSILTQIILEEDGKGTAFGVANAILEAIRARRTYALTGDRIEVDFSVGDFGGFGAAFEMVGPQDWSTTAGFSFWCSSEAT